MTSSADQMFARERADERTQLEEREAIGKVPISLSASLQVWVPIELSSVVESLWASHAAAVDATHSTQNVLVWAQLLRVIAQTPPRLTSHVDAKALTPASRRYLLRVALDALRKALAGTDLHVALADVAAVARNVDVPATIALVNDVVHELAAAAWIDAPLLTASTSAPPRSALLLLADDARAGLVAVFGGQGTPWLPELRQLYRTYASVRDFVDRLVARMVLEADQTFSAAQRRELLAHGVDARLWIAAKDVPDDTYLSSAPISMAMIYVVQMAQLLVALHTWAVPLERLHAALRATTGHSQGLFAAATLSSCTSLQSLADRAERMAALLLCTGVRAQLGCGVPPRLPWRRGDLLRESRVAGDGDPTPMLVVSGLSRAHVDRYVDTINATMLGEGADRVIEVALTNAPTSFVVVGHPESLHALATLLRRAEQPATGANSAPADQARVPHSRRKRLFRQKYIMSSVPFHSQQRLQDAATQLERDAARIGIAIERSALRCAVLATDDGRDLRAESSDSLIGTLLSLVLCRPLNWLATTAPLSRAAGVTHVVDFGPGGMGDAGVLFQRIHEGAGVQVLFAGLFEPTSAAPVGAKPALYDHRLEAVPFAQSWVGRFAPRLVQRRDGRLFVDTKFTRLVGRPPLMVAGMTPTTVNHELVAAVLNAGYHCELAGGGLPREPMFRAKVDALMSLLEPGNGISFNLMFLTPQLWRFQYPLVCDLARNGLPVDGVCVAAGVPSLELATEILTQLSTAGVKHVSFKPGSIAAIQAVCEIAAANPAVEIILQWTGGRGGGHHSFEDFHEPILQTYAQIRRCDNVTLVCGSGFGDAASTWPYLSGSWARHYGKPDMPFDGILVASRVMVAREAATCDAAKKLICDAPGIENEADWEKTYEGAVGGVITVKSEMGEPIHKLATRGVLLWAELDRDFFNIEPKERRTALIQQRKQYLIDRINADSQKVYFGVDERGDACDLEQMTYAGVLRRMIALMYIAAPSTGKPRWIDESYASRVLQFAQRLESLLTHAPRVLPRLHQQRDKLASAPVQRSRLPPLAVLLATPHEWLVSALALFKGAAERQLLASSDVSFFLALCRTGGKPVNFVPVIDDDLAFWFKKDSLWFSEDIDAVPERDVGRVCILQGPVAVRYAKTPNEPVKQILDSIHDGWLELLRADAGAAPLTVVDCIGGAGRGSGESTAAPLVWHKCAVPTPLPDSPARLADVVAHRASPAADMSSEAFRLAIATAATGDSGWLRAVVLVPQIAGARRRAANPFLGALAPRAGLSVVIVRSNKTGHATEFVVFEDGENDARRCVLRLRSLAADSVEAFVYHRHPSLAVSGVHANDQALSAVQMIETPLHLRLAYRPECALCPLFEDEAERARAVRALYRRLWSTEAPVATPPASPARGTTPTPVPAAAAVVRSPSVDVPFGERVWQHSAVCEANSIVSFCRSVGRPVVLGTDGLLRAPIDYAIVLAWDSVVRPLLDDALGGDLLKLVHRSNAFKRGRDAPTGPHENVFRAQQTVRVRVRVVAVEAQAAGLLIAVEATLSEEARELCVLRSEFLFRGDDAKKACGVAQFSDERHERQMNVDDDADVAILRSKSWLVWAAEDGGASLQRGARLVFEVDARLSIDGNGRRSTQARGSVFAIGKTRHQRSLLATVNHTAQALEPSRRGAVLAFLQRHTAPIETAAFFESGGYQMLTEPDRTLAPSENTRYALASGDLNPIHTQPVFARLASLPSTIVHGMWTSANARRVVDALVAHDLPDRVLDYSAEFVGMVPSDEPLLTRVQHIGMRAGRLIVGVNVRGATSGETVLTARADVRTPRTAYVFTGQGSAAKNMGMELFKASEHARAVWNEADAHFVARYGISILQVVRENPKEIVVRFGGTNGAAIRAHYRSLARQVPDAADASRTVSQPLFPEIGEHSSSFTFRHPDGLLFSTEFAQPALVLVELAAFRDMRAHALVADDCTFAGHSLGEYAALASVGQCLELRDLVDIVFLRGITMQNAVVRDSAGRSDFAMIAVNPVRVHAKLFREPQLTELVALVSKSLGKLVQVVNFNVENYQYVVAGDRSALCVMGDALSALKRVKPFRCDAETLELVVKGAMAHFAASHPAGQFVELTRGDATIPLPGIDVPFHSRFLKPGVPAFRAILQQRLASATFDALSLVGRYVPNVTAVPFALSRDYCERVARDTGSEVLRAVLDRFDDYVATPNELGRLILVELLAYQFASPVRWIETQDLFFRDLRVQRLVEIGPAPTLAGMAMRTLESGKFSPLVKREVLWYERDRDAIYYQLEDREVELPPADDVAPAAPAAPAAPVVVAAAAPVAVAAPVAAAPLVAAPVGDDKGATAFEFVQALLASRLQQPVTAIEKTATIKALVGGKSALQNELLGELENELGKLPDSAAAAEMALGELAAGFDKSYRGDGKVSQQMVHRLFSAKMPGAFSLAAARTHLATRFGFGPQRAAAVLLVAAAEQPKARIGDVGAASAWLDTIASAYAARHGIVAGAVQHAVAPVQELGGGGGGGGGGAVTSVDDAPLSALDVLRALVAVKIGSKFDDVKPSDSIRALVGGKSALQNELLGDVSQEFGGNDVEGGGELPLADLAKQLQPRCQGLGKGTTAALTRLAARKLPASFSPPAMRKHLAQRFGLGAGRQDAVLVRALVAVPEQRLDDAGAAAWLDGVARAYAASAGVQLGGASSGAGAGGAGGMVSSAALAAAREQHVALARAQLQLLQSHLGDDPHAVLRQVDDVKSELERTRAELQLWTDEHGGRDATYGDGIRPIFDAHKVRRYDSHWNWTRQDALDLYYEYACGRREFAWNRALRDRLYHLKNRVTPEVIDMVRFYVGKAAADGHQRIVSTIALLLEVLRATISADPVYREVLSPTGPVCEVSERGEIVYREQTRAGVPDMAAYVREMRAGVKADSKLAEAANREAAVMSVAETEALTERVLERMRESGALKPELEALVQTALSNELRGFRRAPTGSATDDTWLTRGTPFLSVRDESGRHVVPELTKVYFRALEAMAADGGGVSFVGKTVLISGCGANSIGLELVKCFLRGGGRVYATTSKFSSSACALYRDVYETHGSAPSQLIVLPCNGASVGDLEAMVEFIYESERADIDIVVPFAAISEQSTEISDIGGRSELAHRLMMTNVVRLLGLIKSKKAQKAIVTRPAHVLLPLSPNHGTFGGDGLYAESKLGLEALMNKWHAEGWRQYLTLAGARIGWTRGTGLMRVNDRVAPALEQLGARTFDVQEQCFNLCALAHPLMIEQAQRAPVFADLNGALHMVDDMRVIVRDVREQINETARVRRAVTADAARDAEADGVSAAGDKAAATAAAAASECLPRANVRVEMPPLPDAKRRAALGAAKGLVDLDKVVVVFGFGEVGPYGNARTRWEMESYGEFSLEGCVELAWMCGLIRADGSGWVDAASGEPVPDHQIKARYEETLLKHSGIRIIEPELFGGYDPEKKMFLRAVALQHDVGPIEVSEAEASQFLRQHGPAHCAAWCDSDGIWRVTLRRGAVLYVPKALRFDRFVAGQIPTHWSPERLGIPADIVRQVDRVTLFTLVSTAEALISAGVTDPYEFYRYVHLRDVGNAIGGGFGGMESMRGVYRDRLMEEPVQGDALQETFINTVAAWVNMLLLSSAGPIKTPVGACATAVESIELGMDTIELGKAAIVVVGGYDDFGEEGSYEFAQMRATSSAAAETAAGREPREMSRPATTTRGGFMESQGAGVQFLTSASLALKMGVPIYGVLASVRTATDKEGRSVPAPGQGILVSAGEHHHADSPLLSLDYRRKQLEVELAAIEAWRAAATAEATAHGGSGATTDAETSAATAQQQLAFVDAQARRKRAAAFEVWGQSFYRGDASIAPLRGALAAWGLTIDDIEVASFHGTGTTANDFNESDVLQRQLEHLGRTRGNSLMAVFQKHFTGHPKGAAAAWMLNGLLQSIQSGIIPGNRNADNIDQSLRQFDHIVYMNRPLQTYGYRAALLKSFGFGQVGGEVLVIHPDYVFAQLDDAEFDGYAVRRHEREQAAYRHIQDSLAGRRPYLAVKTHPPFAPEHEQRVYLDPSCRAVWSDEKQTWMFDVARSDSPRDRRTPTDDDGGMSNLAEVALRAAQSRRSRAASASIARVASDGASELVGAVGDDGDDNDDGERDGDDDDDDDDLSSSPTSPLSPALRRRLPISAQTALEVTLREMSIGMRAPADRGIGVDLQVISEIDAALSSAGERFVARNFTPAEIAYCRQQPNPGASFAGRWAAKESVVKALTNCDNEGGRRLWEGAGAPLVDIEIVATAAGAPRVQLHGHAERVAQALGVSDIRVSISHSGDHAIAHAVAR